MAEKNPPVFPWIGVDFGQKKIGLAVSDPRGIVAMPLAVLPNRADFWQKLREICATKKAGALVVGRPKMPSGTETAMTRAADIFAEKCAAETGLPIRRADEFATSRTAVAALRASVTKKSARVRTADDALAAREILEIGLGAARASGDF